MIGDIIPTEILATRIIANLDSAMAKKFHVREEFCSAALLTTTTDDVTYIALDEATKKVTCDVSFGKSFYGGAGNANTKLAGEILGILTAPDPEMAVSGLKCCIDAIQTSIHFVSANEDDSIIYLAHCISKSGTYLSKLAGVQSGEPLAYLIAPPLESMFGVDAALKAADVRLCILYEPPTETNFGGAILTGSQAACQAACDAFAKSVQEVACTPREL